MKKTSISEIGAEARAPGSTKESKRVNKAAYHSAVAAFKGGRRRVAKVAARGN